MTGKRVVLIYRVVALLGLLSATTGFFAEFNRIKRSEVQITRNEVQYRQHKYQCSYPPSPATPFATTAALALLIARIVITSATGCSCCNGSARPSKSTSPRARFLCFFSWITFVIAFAILLAAAARSRKHDIEISTYSGEYYCPVLGPGVFAGGAVLSLVSSILCIIYFTLISANQGGIPSENPANDPKQEDQGGIAIGKPQFPPKINNAEEPV